MKKTIFTDEKKRIKLNAEDTVLDFYVYVCRVGIYGFLYVASIIVPILFFVVLAGFLWIRYKQRKAVKLMFERNAGRERQHPRGEIIDAEYEIIDDNKH